MGKSLGFVRQLSYNKTKIEINRHLQSWVSSLSYTLSVYNEPTIIKVVYAGRIDLKERLKAVDAVCELLKTSNTKLFLVDATNCTNLMSAAEQVDFGCYVAQKMEFNESKTAVLSTENLRSSELGVNISAQSMGSEIGLFFEEAAALKWLRCE